MPHSVQVRTVTQASVDALVKEFKANEPASLHEIVCTFDRGVCGFTMLFSFCSV